MKKILRFLWIPIAAAILVGGYAWLIEPNLLRVSRQEAAADGKTGPLTVVFFTDTHFGSLYSPDHLSRIVEKINAEKPDLALFGGDFFDAYAKDAALFDLEQIGETLSEIDAGLGKYAVWGNHDRGGGASRVYEQVMEAGGFSVLDNRWVSLPESGLVLAGVDDGLLGTPSLDLSDAPADAFVILLSHEPDPVRELPAGGVDLILSGHSHGGQVSLPFLTQAVLPPGGREFRKGWYRLGESALFVSCGIGTTKLPVRLGNIPEICVFTLTP